MMGFLEAAELFQDSWRLYKKYFSQNKSREMWEELVREVERIYVKHGKQPFAKEILIAVLNETERINKAQQLFRRE